MRLFLQSPLGDQRTVSLTETQAHYLASVLRRAPGDEVYGFNGQDGEWLCRVATLARRTGLLRVEEQSRPPCPENGPRLVFAPIKKGGIDFLVQKATELGVSRLTPATTRLTVSARVNVDRLRANAIEAAEQCGRLTVPEIDQPVALDRLLQQWPIQQRLFVLDPLSRNPVIDMIRTAPPTSRSERRPPPGFLVGPEGGFHGDEIDDLIKQPFVTPVSLGPRILRAETAAIAALVCWQSIAGDWTSGLPTHDRENQ